MIKNASKILIITIILALVLCLAACEKNSENTKTEPAVSTEVETANVTTIKEKTEKEEVQTVDTKDENTEEKQDEKSNPEESNDEKSESSETHDETIADETKVAEYVKNYGEILTSRMETELSAKNVTSTCTVSASGTKLVFTCHLTDYNDVSESDKSRIKIAAISLKPMANTELAKITETEPAVTGADLNICETDGDLITTVSVGK